MRLYRGVSGPPLQKILHYIRLIIKKKDESTVPDFKQKDT